MDQGETSPRQGVQRETLGFRWNVLWLSPEINMPFSALSHSVEQNTGVRSQNDATAPFDLGSSLPHATSDS